MSELDKAIDFRIEAHNEAIDILKQIRAGLMDSCEIKVPLRSPKGFICGFRKEWDFDKIGIRERAWLLAINEYFDKLTQKQ